MGIWSSNIEDTNHQQANCRWLAAVLNISGLWGPSQIWSKTENTFNHQPCQCWAEPHDSWLQYLTILDGCILIISIVECRILVHTDGPQFKISRPRSWFIVYWQSISLFYQLYPKFDRRLLENFSILSAFATEEGDNGICEPKARGWADGKTTCRVTGGWFSCWKITYSGDFLHGFNVNSRVRFATSIWVD